MVNLIATRLDVERIKAAVVEHRFVNVGCVVVRFVADVTAGECVRFRCEAVSDQHAAVFQILTQPREMTQRLRLRQPTREPDEESHIKRASLFKLFE